MLSTPSSLLPSRDAPAARPDDARADAAGTPPGLRRPLRMPLALFGITLLLIIAHQGRLVEVFYPIGALYVAFYFYRRSPAHYIGFVCWLFFLSPEVRRLADFMSGSFNPKSTVMIAPMLAVALSGFSLITHVSALGQRRSAPLVMIILALFYSFVVGMAQVGPAAALYTLVNWLFPVLIGFRLVVTWQDYPAYHRVLLKTCVYGGLVMGVYGVIQYVQPQPWDVFWLLQSQMESEGHPVPFGLRVMSTMNSSGPFAVTIMYVLLMSLAAGGRLRILMCVFAIPALMFTSVRSGWGGLALGLVYPLAMLDGKSRLRLVGAVVAIAALCAPVMMIDQVSENVLKRFNTVQDIGNDNSYQVRAQFYKEFLSVALTDIAGQGLGTTGLGTKLSDDDTTQLSVVFDSGLMEVPFVMGWPGTLLYASGIAILMWRAFLASRLRPHDRFAICGVGVAIAIFAMMVFVNTLTATSGMFFFIGVLMPVIGLRYAREAPRLAAERAAAKAREPEPAGMAIARAKDAAMASANATRGPA
ncbi:hypothetical protein G3N95_29630 [Paraburkholderia sp. Tr-20389]|uniref:hypothetical protein n=1 Tax=Paraburkholderia sp. Tr-20389 TaxID=2703903 RepID=UPI0019803301|nr:hypothetical protein [Paraburkholderia sp. Tr-20389]MBN3757135.1 hypothetical protein [Paraburkholderia sp. Tr-20389]